LIPSTEQADAAGGLGAMSPEALFVLGGISQNIGTTLAKSLFSDLGPSTVAWIRVAFAAIVLLALSWRRWAPWSASARRMSRADLSASAAMGIAISLMNLFFYLAIDRLDIGKGLAIEFIGPIAVAASRTRTQRNAVAVVLAAIGVALLSGFEISGNGVGLLFIFLASAMWAAYIVLGARVARQQRGLAGLGVGLLFGAVLLTPIGLPGSGTVFSSPRLLLACCAVGLFTSVIGYSIDQNILRRISTRRFALLLALLPVTAMFFAFVALDERPSALDLLGVGFVLAGVISQQRDEVPTVLDEPH
jgi:inner membrane transporter RhtA